MLRTHDTPSAMTTQPHVHILVSGEVHGVCFRAETRRMADLLRLSGWVQNLPTGEVEIYAVGPKRDLEKLIQWCHHGPSRAQVTDVKLDWEKYLGLFSSFEVRR